MNQKICILGLGLMGRRAVLRLAKLGHEMVAWNRSQGAGIEAVASVATIASSPREAVQGASAVLLFLHDAKAVSDVLITSGAVDHLPPGALVADMGTNTPETARFVQSRFSNANQFVDAPVSGGTAGIEQGTLSIFLGAAERDVAKATALLGTLGRVSHMGAVGTGQAAKLANQIVVACYIAGLAEGVAFGEALGIAPTALLEAMRGGLVDGKILETIGPRLGAADFTPHGHASSHLKDLNYAFSQVPAAAESLTAASAAQAHLQSLLADFGDLDHAAMLLPIQTALLSPKNPT